MFKVNCFLPAPTLNDNFKRRGPRILTPILEAKFKAHKAVSLNSTSLSAQNFASWIPVKTEKLCVTACWI